CQQGNTNPLTF
nr:immunoglobulin light chain junction region [Macaca mulatta]MOW08311.1 immunoglobulin light chain junction region [Macaca mulatta]MOW08513.1 immunoglobulin light chain junction region [Macaca mulatta]MOW09092.1 immunoglobulin light chain junction region [Macaca mulatta]MOW09318.1 immunoglobulin light chain junction region [Macaca mulatta]